MPFNVSQMTFSTFFNSFIDKSHSSNCPSFNLSLTIERTSAAIFSGVGSFIERTAASTLSAIEIIAISFV